MRTPTGTIEKTVKAKKVKEGDFLLGLDNGYVVDIESSESTYSDGRRFTFHTAEGEEAYLDVPSDMPILIAREAKEQWPLVPTRPEVVEPTPLTPEMVAARMGVATAMYEVLQGVSKMLTHWNDQPSDLLREDEYPFHLSLEDMEAQLSHHIDLIARNNDAAEKPAYKVPTLTVGELIAKLSGYPSDTLLLGYTNATDYVNIDGIGNTDFEGGPALVIECRQDYDSRQF